MEHSRRTQSTVLSAVEVLAILGYVVVLSSYERRCMALLHGRDGPTAYMLLGLAQPIADGAKLLCKGVVHDGIVHPPTHHPSVDPTSNTPT